MNPKISKFNWKEIFSNNSGKTSSSGFSGVITVMIGLLGFVAGVVMYWVVGTDSGAGDILINSLGLISLGTVLLGVRKVKNESGSINRNDSDDKLLKS